MANETEVIDKPTDLDATANQKTDAPKNDVSLLDKPADPKAADPSKPEGSMLDKPADSQKTPDKPVVPETYADPKLPEGFTLIPELKAKFDPVAKELGLSQEQYQKVVDIQTEYSEAQMKQTMDSFSKQIQDWTNETRKELGANAEKELSVASKAIDTIFPDPKDNKAFRDMMTESGLGNWNLMVKAFTFVGKKLSEDTFVAGKPGATQRKSTEEVLFDHPTSVASMKNQ